jgi:hypothetical protein
MSYETTFHALFCYIFLEALILRLSAVSEDLDVETRKVWIEEKVLSMSQGKCFPESSLNDITQYAIQMVCPKEGETTKTSRTVKNTTDHSNIHMGETEGQIILSMIYSI